MTSMRFNHMGLTLPRGTLTKELRDAVGDFYGDVFGWKVSDVDVMGQQCLYLRVDDGQFILCVEVDDAIHSPGDDHLGLLMETRAEVDETLAAVKRRAETDPRVQIKESDDLVMGHVTVHAFYLKYLLPIEFEVQCMEYRPGTEPATRWVLQHG